MSTHASVEPTPDPSPDGGLRTSPVTGAVADAAATAVAAVVETRLVGHPSSRGAVAGRAGPAARRSRVAGRWACRAVTAGRCCSSPASWRATSRSRSWRRGCASSGYTPKQGRHLLQRTPAPTSPWTGSRTGASRTRTWRSGRKVAIVGHSRGGHFARALAVPPPRSTSRRSSRCRVGASTSRSTSPSRPGWPSRASAVLVARRDPERAAPWAASPPRAWAATPRTTAPPFPESVPLTSLYSKGDGVVRWRACVVPYARCVEVTGSHIGLAFNRHAYREIAATLAGRRASV